MSERRGIAARKGNQLLGMIKRNITYRDKNRIIPLYKSTVRPRLERCIYAWRPHIPKYIDKLERVERRATKANSWQRLSQWALWVLSVTAMALVCLQRRRRRTWWAWSLRWPLCTWRQTTACGWAYSRWRSSTTRCVRRRPRTAPYGPVRPHGDAFIKHWWRSRRLSRKV